MNYQQFLEVEMPQYLSKIQAETPAQWGIMTAQHMIEHLSILLAISNGKINVPSYFDEAEQAKRKQGFFIQKRPFIKNFSPQNARKLLPLRFDNIEAATEKLLANYEVFKKHFNNKEITALHPVFGELNQEEWTEFHARHIMFHLAQFGMMEVDETILAKEK